MIDYGPLGTKCGRKVLYPVADAELTALAAEKSADGAA